MSRGLEGMMFGIMTNLLRNFLGHIVGYIDSLIVTNIPMFPHAFQMIFIMANFWFVVVVRIVSMGALTIACFMFWLLMAYLFSNIFANFLGDIFTFLDFLMLNDSPVNCLIMCFTLYVGFLLMI